MCCLIITGGLRCPDLIQRHQAVLGLVVLCVNFSKGEQNGTAPRWRSLQACAITALYWQLPVTESSVTLPPDVTGLHHDPALQASTMSKVQNSNNAGTDHPRPVRL
jgi:hypothetical protein